MIANQIDTITEKERRIASHYYALVCFEDIIQNRGESAAKYEIAYRNYGFASPEYAMVLDSLIAMADEDEKPRELTWLHISY